MRVLSELPGRELSKRLHQGHLRLHIGPYVYRIASNLPRVIAGIETLYRDFPLAESDGFDDFSVGMSHTGFISRMRGRADFLFEHQRPLGSVPTRQAYAFLEWGMNWCISLYVNEYLKLHAAAVARDDLAIIMPGIPGAGKSTLCAAMGLSGWQVLSDEHALIPPGTTRVVPIYRPISLKNESIAAIKAFDPKATFGPVSKDTHKGTVAHLKADLGPGSHEASPINVGIMLFPKYSQEEPQRLSPHPRTHSFILAAYHSFNYSLLGLEGFQAMKTLIDGVECYDLVYNDLDWALHTVGELHDRIRNR